MHACKNTTINLTKANTSQTASKVYATEVPCDDMFVRKKMLITCYKKNSFNNNNKHNHFEMSF